MGCSVSKPSQNVQISSNLNFSIPKNKAIIENDVAEIEEVDAARPDKRKISLGMDVASKVHANHNKSLSTNLYLSVSSDLPNKTMIESNIGEKSNLFFSPEKNSSKKIEFESHEHKFEFEFLDQNEEESRIDNEINDVFLELNNL